MKIKFDCAKHGEHEEDVHAVILIKYIEREWETTVCGELPPAVLIVEHDDHFDSLRTSDDDPMEVLEPFMRKLMWEAWRKFDEGLGGAAS